VSGLFDEPEHDAGAADELAPDAPLAERMRPRSLAEFAGQTHLVGERRILASALAGDLRQSLILWGPPGSGKTTLARLLARANDVRFGANGYLTLQARADAKLTVSAHRPRVGRTFTVSGRLRGVSRGGVPVIVQGRRRGSRRYDTFADTTTASNGRFKVTYRFRNAGSRGRSFVFRARIRPAARFPYETGYSRTVTVKVR
jgi:hypothetical protein